MKWSALLAVPLLVGLATASAQTKAPTKAPNKAPAKAPVQTADKLQLVAADLPPRATPVAEEKRPVDSGPEEVTIHPS